MTVRAVDSEQRTAVPDTPSTLQSPSVDTKDVLTVDMHKDKKVRYCEFRTRLINFIRVHLISYFHACIPLCCVDKQPAGSSTDGGSVQPIGEGQGGSDIEQTDVDGGGESEEQPLQPQRTFLTDVVLSWTMKDVLNGNLYKHQVQFLHS